MVATGLKLVANTSPHLVFFVHQFAARRFRRLAGVTVIERFVGELAEDPFLQQRALPE